MIQLRNVFIFKVQKGKIKFYVAVNNSNFSHSYAAAIAITKSSCKYLKPYNLLTDLLLICWGHGYNEDLKFR